MTDEARLRAEMTKRIDDIARRFSALERRSKVQTARIEEQARRIAALQAQVAARLSSRS